MTDIPHEGISVVNAHGSIHIVLTLYEPSSLAV